MQLATNNNSSEVLCFISKFRLGWQQIASKSPPSFSREPFWVILNNTNKSNNYKNE
jgi:hypothetical protein